MRAGQFISKFVSNHAGQLSAILTKGDDGQVVHTDLAQWASDVKAQTKVWPPGPEAAPLRAVASQVKVEVVVCDHIGNSRRAELLRRVVQMISPD